MFGPVVEFAIDALGAKVSVEAPAIAPTPVNAADGENVSAVLPAMGPAVGLANGQDSG